MSGAVSSGSFVALCGGVGGAKLALGLSKVLAPEQLTILVNTGDDFDHLGLHISPDIDTVLYTLAGLANPDAGWGLSGESWNFMARLTSLGGPGWFNLGDGDLATHVLRTAMLARGHSLTEVTDHLRRKMEIGPAVVPMSDEKVQTIVDTAEGALPFQSYFVKRRCEPTVRAVRYEGASEARASGSAAAALAADDLAGILICPSNPILSIDPILAVPDIRTALENRRAPAVAVTPLIGGRAVKGPTARNMAELGEQADAAGVAARYRGLIDGFVLDQTDADLRTEIPILVLIVQTLMRSLDDRIALARATIDFCRAISGGDGKAARTAG